MKNFYLLLLFFFQFVVSGQTWIETQKLVADDREEDDFFGHSGQFVENELLIGAFGNEGGAVYVFTENDENWLQSQKIIPIDIENAAVFGRMLDYNNDVLVIADPSKKIGNTFLAGAVHIFKKNQDNLWEEQQTLTANTIFSVGKFGQEIAIFGNTLVVGCDFGNANLFNYNANTDSWVFIKELSTSDGSTYDISVDINENHMALGRYDSFQNGLQRAGAVYVYEYDAESESWVEIQKILSEDLSAEQRFGKKVVFHNQFLFVAAVETEDVYVYTFNETTNQFDYLQTLGGPSGFGNGISAEDNRLVIGANRHSINNGSQNITQVGSVTTYLWSESTQEWEFEQFILHNNPNNNDWFGNSTSIHNEVIYAGSPYNDTDADYLNDENFAGAAILLELDTNLSSVMPEKNEAIFFYPNPAGNYVNITSSLLLNRVQIFNTSGNLVFQKESDQLKKLLISHLSQGLYFIRVYTDSGYVFTSKFIKN